MPQMIVTCSMCIRERTWFISSTGQGAPPIIPVRRLERSRRSASGCSSSAMNIVGTPYRDVQRSPATASSTAPASNDSPGTTMHAPWVAQPSVPSTIPNVW